LKVRLERKTIRIGETVDVPDYSYNHAYSSVDGESINVLYLVPATEEDAIKAMSPKSQKEKP
jgi:hypothetical protein